MSFYSVNFSGGMWSNDSREDPYYCGVYSSLDQAIHFTRKTMIEDLKNCDHDQDDDGNDLNLEDMLFTELESYYDDCMDCTYEIQPVTCTNIDFQYTIDYRPTGATHEFLGSYASLEEAKTVILSKMRENIKTKKILTDEETLKEFEKRATAANEFFVTKIKVDSDLFHVIWDGDYDTPYTLTNAHTNFEWCTLLTDMESKK